jgi:hypothetical protein
MTDNVQGRQRKLKRLWLALAVLVAILAVLIVPPLVSVSHYKSQITQLMARSLDRPVRLSSVRLRLLPWPGFVLTDLTVEEDPAYGAEPVLHASTVKASIRLLPLWRGRLEISRISVDEASLNLVRTAAGQWNLDPFFRTAAAKAGPSGTRVPFPGLEATNSRINIKNGAEKLPFSLIDTDLSFWQENPGDWRVRLRGQPVRTDLSLETGDTGVVRLEARVHNAPELRQMPVHLDMEWKQAQLGQLTRLVFGSDPGWRGDLTGELHLDGTAESAQVKSRLRATGVHRAEFTPAEPLDFDARCGFVYHYSRRAVEKLSCDSPLGNGQIRLTGDMPGQGALPNLTVELDRVPVAAGLDALRTVRSGFGPGLVAKGAISGKMTYAAIVPATSAKEKPGKTGQAKATPAPQGALAGSFTVEGLDVSGDGLSSPIQASKMVLEPVAVPQGHPQAIAGTVIIAAGEASPLNVDLQITRYGYQMTVHGQASLARARELAHVAGMAESKALDGLSGDAVALDLTAGGPWLPAQAVPFGEIPRSGVQNAQAPVQPSVDEAGRPVADSLSGTATLHNAIWKTDLLVNPVEIAQATVKLDKNGTGGETRWDPVIFSYGPVKGTATLTVPASCGALATCPPHFEVAFGELDASALQAAILGAHKKGTLISTLIDKLHPASSPLWPRLDGTVKAGSLILGPVTLREAVATVRILPTGAEITGIEAGLLGGRLRADGTLQKPATDRDKPAYSFTSHFEKLSPAAVGQMLGQHWSGGTFQANGKIDLSGYTGKELAASVKGAMHFEWQHGSAAASPKTAAIPALARFDHWTADAAIANGAITLGQNQVQRRSQKQAIEGGLTFGKPPKVNFTAPKPVLAQKH